MGDFGLLSKLLLISGLFGTAGSLGFQLMAQRDLPALFAEGRYRNGLIALCKAITVTTTSAFLISAFSLLNIPVLGVSGFLFCCSIVHGWSQQVFMLAVIDTRSRLEMMRYAKQVLFKTVVASFVAGGIAALGGGPLGIIFAELFVTLLLSMRLIAAITRNVERRFLWKISVRSFKGNDFSTALTLFLSTLLMFFSTNIDRWLAADRLTHDDFGLYSFAWISLTAALSFQALLNAGIFPLISKRRKEGHAKAAFRTTAYISVATLIVGAVVSVMVYLFAQWFLPNLYQRYAPALPLIMPLLFAAVLRLSDFWSSYLIVMHRQNLLMKIQVFLILIPCFYYFATGHSSVFTPMDFAWLAVLLAAGNYILNALAAVSNKNEA